MLEEEGKEGEGVGGERKEMRGEGREGMGEEREMRGEGREGVGGRRVGKEGRCIKRGIFGKVVRRRGGGEVVGVRV